MNEVLLKLDKHKNDSIEFKMDCEAITIVIAKNEESISYVLDPNEFEIFLSFLKLKELL
jgi:hypothetical protein